MENEVLGCGKEGGNLSRGPGSGCGSLPDYGLWLPRGNWACWQGNHCILGKQEKEAVLLLEPLTPPLLQSETAGNLGPAASRVRAVVWTKAWGPT